jgi:hypothetical protein
LSYPELDLNKMRLRERDKEEKYDGSILGNNTIIEFFLDWIMMINMFNKSLSMVYLEFLWNVLLA